MASNAQQWQHSPPRAVGMCNLTLPEHFQYWEHQQLSLPGVKHDIPPQIYFYNRSTNSYGVISTCISCSNIIKICTHVSNSAAVSNIFSAFLLNREIYRWGRGWFSSWLQLFRDCKICNIAPFLYNAFSCCGLMHFLLAVPLHFWNSCCELGIQNGSERGKTLDCCKEK